MGAVIGAALAAGVPFDQVRRRALGLRRKDVAPIDPRALVLGLFSRSLIRPSALRDTIARVVSKARFEYLRIPLTVTATDLESGELVLLGGATQRELPEIELLDALYASCALPLYFPPLEVDGRRLADGGLRAVLPLAAARALEPKADLFIAVDVGPGFDERLPPGAVPARIPRLVRAHGEAIRIMMAEQVEHEVKAWPTDGPKLMYVRPVAEKEATFAVERIQDYVEMGYQAIKKALA
jgi:NTE family protein